ncbi:MAG TPA: UTP--glucose-1-phosphate uridylyltransferase [Spirochaetota bacterium]|nr:UTP--glucose-1-phosphate uridylyltransferase [Spirochaetota bacterium]HOL57087.1 UTP--glucose-1-phosphate uridylyltransferase [Spirochaetota bacterium]HPP04696.1 UTP--glucose-1-phosphate uridylyltransferase [Spirochaetota bacterium]
MIKGIIIAAGYGTRFLPATKTVPKEMFPLIDKPAIDFIVDEFIQAGIKDILIVTSRRKKILEDYFDREVELETIFKKENDAKKLDLIKPRDIEIYFVRQKEMLGTGHAILICKDFIGNDPFVVAYPDDLVFSNPPLTKKMIDLYDKTKCSILAVENLEGEDVSRYGVIDYELKENFLRVKSIIEKPAKGKEPSKMISIGRYLFTKELLDYLIEDYKYHQKGEFYHINAINKLANTGKLFATEISGERVDVGDKIGYLNGIIKYALTRDDLKEEVLKILKNYIPKNC